jgi:hypothetical protein
MDTSRQVADVITSKSEPLGAAPRQRRSIAEKRRIVEETLVEGASVARVARAQGNPIDPPETIGIAGSHKGEIPAGMPTVGQNIEQYPAQFGTTRVKKKAPQNH